MRSLSELSVIALLALHGCAAPPSASVAGLVWLGEEPGEGAEVTLVGPVTRVLSVDDRGEWVARGLPEGAYAVTATAASTLETEVTATVQVTGSSTCEALRLTPVGTVSGRLVGEGASGATVVVSGGPGQQTGADGAFRLPRVPAGEREVVLWAPGFATVRSRVMVRRGEDTALAPVTLPKLEQQRGPQVGTLSGRVWVPGLDESGVTVRVEGLGLETVTTADGAFRFLDVPAGAVSLSFERGLFTARLPRVLVVPGTGGFIVGTALEALEARPVKLTRGVQLATGVVRLLGAHQGWSAWREQNRVWLRSPQGTRHLVVEGNFLEFVGDGFREGAFWAAAEDRYRRLTVVRFELARMVSHRFEQVGSHPRVVGDGLAWTASGALFFQPTASSRPVERYASEVRALASLGEGVLVLLRTGFDSGFVVRLDRDGTERRRVPIGAAEGIAAISPDGRWVLLWFLNRGAANLVDLTTGTLRTITCDWPAFSPESDRLWCTGTVHDLGTDTSRQLLAANQTSFRPPLWLPGGAIGYVLDRFLVFRPGGSTLEVPGTDPFGPRPFVTSTGRVRLLGRIDGTTGLGEALELSPSDGTVTVLAEGVERELFTSTEHGVFVARPSALGSDAQLTFVRPGHPDLSIGRWLARGDFGSSVSPDGRFLSGVRFQSGRGVEAWVLDMVDGRLTPFAFDNLNLGLVWDGPRRLIFATDEATPPGVFTTELP